MNNYWKSIDKDKMMKVILDNGYGVNDISVGDKVWITDSDFIHHSITEGLVTKVTKSTVHVQMVNNPVDISIYYRCNYRKYSSYTKYLTYKNPNFGYVLCNENRFTVEN